MNIKYILPLFFLSFSVMADNIGTNEDKLRRLSELKSFKNSNGENLLSEQQLNRVTESACANSLAYLSDKYSNDGYTKQNLLDIANATHSLPESYIGLYPESSGSTTETRSAENPWSTSNVTQPEDALFNRMIDVFTNWCEFLPDINGNKDTGLAYIQEFAWLYYRNPYAKDWVQGEDAAGSQSGHEHVGLNFLTEFTKERGAYMDSSESISLVPTWSEDDRIEIEDYYIPEGGFSSWNDFFTREIIIDTNPDTGNKTIRDRPVTKPDEDYIISSPTDCIMNPLVQVLDIDDLIITNEDYIENPLELNSVINVKNTPITISDMLGSASNELKQEFVGGTGLSCVLMPNTYHSFHTPVSGIVKHKEVVAVGTYGYPDFPNWVPIDGNVGRPGTDFSQFKHFQRGVVIIEVTYKNQNTDGSFTNKVGYVASIPVGLDTIGSVVLADGYDVGDTVTRGFTRLGNFRYGGSLDILLFSKGMVSPVIQTRLGSQIAIIDSGKTPAVNPPIPDSTNL